VATECFRIEMETLACVPSCRVHRHSAGDPMTVAWSPAPRIGPMGDRRGRCESVTLPPAKGQALNSAGRRRRRPRVAE
jgi:hypothetical protein